MTLYRSTFEIFDRNFMGSSTMAIIAQSCLGAIAAMYILSNGTSFLQMAQLALIVLTCIFANTSILAQMKHKTVFDLTVASIVISIALIMLNLIF